MTTSRDEAQALILRNIEAYNSKDFDGLRATYADDFVAQDFGLGYRIEGPDNVLVGRRSTAARFPDRHMHDVGPVWVDGDVAIVEASWSGTPAPTGEGPPPHWHVDRPDSPGAPGTSGDSDSWTKSDATATVRFCRVCTIRDGRIATMTDYTVTDKIA